MTPKHRIFKAVRLGATLLLMMPLLLAACSDAGPTALPSRAERIAGVTALFARRMQPPSQLLDGAWLQQTVGQEGGLGPTDYQWWVYARVDLDQVERWSAAFKPLAQRPHYVAAPGMAHWPSAAEFEALEFFEAGGLSIYPHGWIALSRSRGVLFLYTFTL